MRLGRLLSASFSRTRLIFDQRRLFQNRVGVTAVEYGLLVALISLFILAVIRSIGTGVSSTMTTISNSL